MAASVWKKTQWLAALVAGAATIALPVTASAQEAGQARGEHRGGWNGGARPDGQGRGEGRGGWNGGGRSEGRGWGADRTAGPAPQRGGWSGRADSPPQTSSQRPVQVQSQGQPQVQPQPRQQGWDGQRWNGQNWSNGDRRGGDRNWDRGRDTRPAANPDRDGDRRWDRDGNRGWSRDGDRRWDRDGDRRWDRDGDRRWDRDGDRRWDRDRRWDSRPNWSSRPSAGWNRDWRNDRRYSWRDWRSNHREVYRLGRYNPPYRSHVYSRIGIGFTLQSGFFGASYWINDPWAYRLPPAYGPYRWVRYYDDAMLVDTYSGEVVDVIYDFFW